MKLERIAKRMAAAGLCSRREAERWIEQGRVHVNGSVIHTPATTVTAEDTILVDNTPLPTVVPVYLFAYHKPAGIICTERDTHGRPTVLEQLPETMPRVVTVGRLDLNSEGLLLLTTSGSLAKTLMHPNTGLERTYRVRTFGNITEKALDKLRTGITVEDIRYQPMIIEHVGKPSGRNQWLTITLTEGKNREIRKALGAIDVQVNRLIRTHYGPYALNSLPQNSVVACDLAPIKHLISHE